MPLDTFTEYLNREAGDALRVVTWYTADDFGGVYVREDLDREAVLDRIQFLSERLMRGSGPIEGSPMDELGGERAMVQVRENAVILRFPFGDHRGVVVSLDVEVARNLHGFVVECARKLESETLPSGSSAGS